jgi:hypothetical protein
VTVQLQIQNGQILLGVIQLNELGGFRMCSFICKQSLTKADLATNDVNAGWSGVLLAERGQTIFSNPKGSQLTYHSETQVTTRVRREQVAQWYNLLEDSFCWMVLVVETIFELSDATIGRKLVADGNRFSSYSRVPQQNCRSSSWSHPRFTISVYMPVLCPNPPKPILSLH